MDNLSIDSKNKKYYPIVLIRQLSSMIIIFLFFEIT